jgi:hypothetical protein
MMKFWDGRLPFKGQIIHWRYDPKTLAPDTREATPKRGRGQRATDLP